VFGLELVVLKGIEQHQLHDVAAHNLGKDELIGPLLGNKII
jgi:hypothetical protein